MSITINHEIREDVVYIYGNWDLGEIRADFSELEGLIPRLSDKYSAGDRVRCRSCKSYSSQNPTSMYILEVGTEELVLCESCHNTLKQEIKEIGQKHSTFIMSSVI